MGTTVDVQSLCPSTSVHPVEISQSHDLASLDPTGDTPDDRFSLAPHLSPTLATVFRHSGWLPMRRRIYAAFQRVHINPARQSAFAFCGDQVRVLRSDQDPTRYKLVGSYCHDRWCTPCATERARTIANNVLELANVRRLRFVTLTLAGSATPLVHRVHKIRLSFSRLRATRLWKTSVKAAIACLEVKWNPGSHNWHVHFHVLAQGRYIPHAVLKQTWHNITGDSYVVDIRLANDRRKVAKYLTKYASKPLDPSYMRDDHRLDEAIQALHNVRLVEAYGMWRGKPLTKPPSDGTWTEVYDLDELFYAVLNGSESAKAIMRKLVQPGYDDAMTLAMYRNQPTTPRPPPPNHASQARLWPDTPISF